MRRHLLAGTSVLAILAGTTSAGATMFTYDGSTIQPFQVPVTGTYDITAAGAQGANSGSTFGKGGGLGAIVGGDVMLTGGITLHIAVGGTGLSAAGGYTGAGGGGGSFVIGPSGIVAIAGGGGGGGLFDSGGGGLTGSGGGFGSGNGSSTGGGIGGSGGGGGVGGNISFNPPFDDGAGGGGGYTGSGTGGGILVAGGYGGQSYGGGLTGGGGYAGSGGGFGGGGGGGFDNGGGGGGFSGGGGGGGSGGGGGGGGSFLATDFANIAETAGDNSGDGYVTITLVPSSGPGPSVPEPGTMGLFASALAGFGLIRRRRQRVRSP